MSNRISLAAAALATLLAPSMVPAAQPTLPALAASQVVEKNVAARGGLSAWHAVQALTLTGKMGAGASTYSVVTPAHKLQTKTREEAQLPFVLQYKRPMKMRLELQFNGQTAVQVFDGTQGYKLRPFLGKSEWEPYSAEELKQAQSEPGIDGLLIDYAAKGAKVESDGTDSIEGHPAYKLKVTQKGGQVRHVWVDGKSFLDIKLEGEPRRMDGRLRAVDVYLRDFKPEHGLVIPHVQESAVQGVKTSERIVIETVAVNPILDDARFTKSN